VPRCGSEFTSQAASLQGDSEDLAVRTKRNMCDLTCDCEPSSGTAAIILNSHQGKSCTSAAKTKFCDLGCAPKSGETRKLPAYVTRRLATAALKLAAAMMARSQIVHRYTRAKFTLIRSTSADLFFSCCDSVAAPRQRPGHQDQVPEKNNERRRGHLPRRTRILKRRIRVKFSLSRWTPSDLYFSCCDSNAVAATA
jgi:hypothetical protein